MSVRYADLEANGALRVLVRILSLGALAGRRHPVLVPLLTESFGVTSVGRLLEIQRRPEHSWLPGEKEGLVTKVFTRQSFPRSMAVAQDIDALEVRAQDLLAHETTLAIQQWRDKMQLMGTATRRYVHHTAGCPGFQFKSTNSGVNAQSGTPSEALNMLEEHWSQIWRRETPDLTEAWNYWQNNASSTPMTPLPWKPLLPCELYTQAQGRTGKAAGCDGWSGSEVAALPFRAWEGFSLVAIATFCRPFSSACRYVIASRGQFITCGIGGIACGSYVGFEAASPSGHHGHVHGR